MKIGELAKKTGCAPVTIRYYEKEGLLPVPERGHGNYRVYDEEDVARLRFIRHCRQHDMSLAEIGDLLRFRDNPTVKCDWINALVDQHIVNVEARIAALEDLKAYLFHLRDQCQGGKGSDCGILQHLDPAGRCAHCGKNADAAHDVAATPLHPNKKRSSAFLP